VLEDVILVDKIQNKTNKTHPPSFALVAKLAVLSLYWQVIVFAQPHHHRSMCHIDDETPRLEFFLIAHLDKPIKRLQRRPCTRYRRRSALHAVLTCSERGDHSVCVSDAHNRATTQLSLRGMAHICSSQCVLTICNQPQRVRERRSRNVRLLVLARRPSLLQDTCKRDVDVGAADGSVIDHACEKRGDHSLLNFSCVRPEPVLVK
jgi:hypothetical protein